MTAHGALYAMVTIQGCAPGDRAGMVIMRVTIKRPPEIAFGRRPYFTRRVFTKNFNEFIMLTAYAITETPVYSQFPNNEYHLNIFKSQQLAPHPIAFAYSTGYFGIEESLKTFSTASDAEHSS